ncbi:MAG: DUF2855 family protein [Sandaracinobacter sp.]
MTGYSIERARTELSRWRQVPIDLEPADGEVIARIDRAALTSNNVTYAVHGGPPLFYWNFFPASDADWGVVPVWGYATIIASRVPHVAVGSRFYGYWPSATHVRLQTGPLKAGGFSDLAPHRQALAPVYNSYRPADDVSDPAVQALSALFQPLYGTGFVLAHSLAADVAAGRTIILTSASSKTALATAFNLAGAGAKPVGLTSAANQDFVEQSGLYAKVLTYDAVEGLDPSAPSVLVDFAGNGALKARIHAHLKGLTASHIVGDTDWASPGQAELQGPQPALFFAPSAWEARAREIGPAAFEAELAASLSAFLETTPRWLTVETVAGAGGHAAAFDRLLANKSPASLGIVWEP